MDYELAKKLKDAGFPQYSEKTSCQHRTPQSVDEECAHRLNYETCEVVSIPSLSELIEACGHLMISNIYNPDDWRAQQENGVPQYGSTPEEAVAHLLLKLSGGNIKEWMEKNTGIGKEKE